MKLLTDGEHLYFVCVSTDMIHKLEGASGDDLLDNNFTMWYNLYQIAIKDYVNPDVCDVQDWIQPLRNGSYEGELVTLSQLMLSESLENCFENEGLSVVEVSTIYSYETTENFKLKEISVSDAFFNLT